MNIQGKFVKLGTLTEGTSARGAWRKQELIIETIEQYPKQVCLVCWGDTIDAIQNLADGDRVSAGISIESREFNGKWYTDVRAFNVSILQRVDVVLQQTSHPIPQAEPMTYQDNRTPQQNVMDFLQADDSVEDNGDLPF